MAQTIQQGSRFLYRNPDFNSYGVLNVREDFISTNPEAVQAVVDSYEEARQWAKAHPDELAALLASQAKVAASVAQEELQRTAFDIPAAPGDPQRTVLNNILPIAVGDADIKSDDAGVSALNTILVPKYAAQVH